MPIAVPLRRAAVPGAAWGCAMRYTSPNLQKLAGIFDERPLHFWTLRLPLGDSDARVDMVLTARQVAR